MKRRKISIYLMFAVSAMTLMGCNSELKESKDENRTQIKVAAIKNDDYLDKEQIKAKESLELALNDSIKDMDEDDKKKAEEIIESKLKSGEIKSNTDINKLSKDISSQINKETGKKIEEITVEDINKKATKHNTVVITKPSKPVVKPETKPTKPSKPVVKPETKPTKPSKPTVKPETKPTKPSKPVVKPETKPTKPSKPVVKPETKPTKPSKPAVKPETKPTKPSKPVVKPETKPTKPVHEHNWVPVYKTIHHPATGHYETIEAWDEPIMKYAIRSNYDHSKLFYSYDDFSKWDDEMTGAPGYTGGYTSGDWQVGTKHHEAEQIFIPEKPAWDEKVIDHYECDCGETKK